MSYSQSINSGATWLALRQPESVPRTATGSDDPAVWLEVGWYMDTLADYPPDTNPVLKAGPDYSGDPTVDGTNAVWPVKVYAGQDARNALAQSVVDQVPQITLNAYTLDPALQSVIMRSETAATKKLTELEDVADVDLSSFDVALAVTDAGDTTVARNQLTVEITDLPEWAGQPGADIGFKVVLRTEEGREVDGAELRISVVDAPADNEAVIPSVQDATDPRVWTVTSRTGFNWSDPELSASVRAIWGSGSVYVTPVIKVLKKGAEYRVPRPIEYGLP